MSFIMKKSAHNVYTLHTLKIIQPNFVVLFSFIFIRVIIIKRIRGIDMIEKDNKKRLKEIIDVLVKNDIKSGITPSKVCAILKQLGPTFIKIGQILSTRIDIIPKEYCDSLSNLRANVGVMSKEELDSILKEEYGNPKEIFKEIGQCIGSASISEVHEATLINGDKVVIKVCRKNVYEQMQIDVMLLKKAIKLLHLDKMIKIISLDKSLDELLSSAYEESNFKIEKEHLIKFRKLNSDVNYISSPKLYSNISTNKVLVMEYVRGISLSKKDELIKKSYDLEKLSYLLSDNYIKQALDDGFFHADPHPDNIMVKDDKIVYIDLGMMGTLKEKNKKLLNYVIEKILEEDYYEIAKTLSLMCSKNDELDISKLKGDVEAILLDVSNSNLKDINIAKFISNMFIMLKNNNLELDKDVTMLIRGILIIESTLEIINPNLSFIDVLSNHVLNKKKSIIDKEKVINEGSEVIKNTKSLVKIPNEVLTFFKTLNNGESKIKFEMSASKNQVDKIEKLLHELIIGIIDASLILALSNEKNELIRKILILFIIILSIWLFIKMLIDHIHKGY